MKQKKRILLSLLLCLSILSTIFVTDAHAAITITSNQTGTYEGYDYELWKDSGNTTMTLTGGGTFTCEWNNINNALFRTGKKYNETQTHQQIGNISVKYGCDYQPNGNSYLCVYGWTVDPLVEYYIVDSWGNWRPPGATSKGRITVDGGTYDIYETTRVNQPSIKGTATFQQYWSVRTSKRTSGTISVSEHFNAWESRGMKMGKMYEVAFTIEGYQSSGKANVHTMSLVVGGDSGGGDDEVDYGVRSAFETIEAEEFNSTTSSTLETIGIANGEGGIGYIESGDTITYKDIDFGSGGATSFSALVASEQNTSIQIRLGSETGTLLGTLSDAYTGGWDTYETKSTNISKVTGKQDIVLVFSGPVNVNSFIFSAKYSSVTKGDVNVDGNVDAIDYSLLKSYLLKRDTSLGEEAADINSDGYIDALDFSLLKKMILENDNPNTTPTPTPTQVPSYNKVVALTFDDGPDTTLTPLVLDKLEKYGVVATFMVIGQKLNDSTSSVIKRMVNMGCEIGNHSWTYSTMTGMSEAEIRKSVNDTNAAIERYSGTKAKFFRAPNLATNNTMLNAIDLTFVGGVTCDDWIQSTTAQQRADAIIRGARDGAILLMHDVQPLPHPTPEALDIIIPTLLNQGYKFVTLSELFEIKGVTLNPNDNNIYTYLQ